MSQHHAIPRRASIPPEERRTTQAYPIPRQAMRQTTARQSAPADAWGEDEEPEERETRANWIPNSARRYLTVESRELVPTQSPSTRSTQRPRPPHRKHPLLYVGVGMLTALTAATLILGPGGKWWSDWRNYTVYGDPRTFQTDAIVGQNDGPGHESHFLAVNLHGQIIVIEFPGSDPSKGRDFLITTLSGSDAGGVPITLTFADINGDGKPDMLVHFAGQEVVYINDRGTFRPAKPGETTDINE
ncbi:MAG TPA: VCBS repeat-containing protein [Ktedonobacteraceae bacterium]|nr:VCBS repeat-containing protein [Ktedonobacteraceae bacterium]